MPQPVTDPDLLRQLEGGAGPRPVSDPALLAQLEGQSEQHRGVDWGGVAGRIASWPGRIAGTVAEGLMSGPKLMGDVMEGRTDPMSKEAIGRSFEAATAVTPMAPGVGAARMVAPASKAARVAAPEREELAASSLDAYKELKNKNVPLRADVVEDLSNTLRSKLNEDFHPEDQPKTYGLIERLKNPLGPDSSAKEVYQVRTRLNNIIGDQRGTSEGRAAKVALEHIDNYLSNVPGFAETAKQARGDYRAGMASDRVTEAVQKARAEADTSGSGANTANKLRQAIRKLRYNKKGNWNPAEQELMDEIISPTGLRGRAENIARLVSKLGPKHPLSGWGTAIAADFSGGAGTATAGLGIGHLAQWLSERAPAKKIEALDEAIRMNSPLGQSRAMAGPPPMYRQPYGVPPTGAAAFPAVGGMLAPGAGSPLGGAIDALSPVSSAQAAENPPRGKPPADEALADKPTHGGALALPEVGGGGRVNFSSAGAVRRGEVAPARPTARETPEQAAISKAEMKAAYAKTMADAEAKYGKPKGLSEMPKDESVGAGERIGFSSAGAARTGGSLLTPFCRSSKSCRGRNLRLPQKNFWAANPSRKQKVKLSKRYESVSARMNLILIAVAHRTRLNHDQQNGHSVVVPRKKWRRPP